MKFSDFRQQTGLSSDDVIQDYKTAFLSREASLLGRKEVLSGRAKFGIFGDGKEIGQVAMARSFQNGDWRSGYYRDQTLAFALGISNVEDFFSQLFADSDLENDPASGGRQMNSHFCTRFLSPEGEWLSQMQGPQSSSDISPTAGQMARLVGLGYASKLYRNNKRLKNSDKFTNNGNEIAFGTIGDASTSEGVFWESLNASGVLQVPVVMTVWDDGYGISVPKKYQTSKESISKVCAGFNPDNDSEHGVAVQTVKGWDYASLVTTYRSVSDTCRTTHQPYLIHVEELTQPQGHSTSGSHERYKSEERLQYEIDFDALSKFKEWILSSDIISENELSRIEEDIQNTVHAAKDSAWNKLQKPIQDEKVEILKLINDLHNDVSPQISLAGQIAQVKSPQAIFRRVFASSARQSLLLTRNHSTPARTALQEWTTVYQAKNQIRYSRALNNESKYSATRVTPEAAVYTEKPAMIEGNLVINQCFDNLMEKDPRIFIVGEDVGQLGGVNREFDGLQDKFGIESVTDTGIREATILGQGIGSALRGLRPLVDIQYLDYVLYCLQGMSDDLATLHYRTAGGQIAPVIVRTKGHRLEGIWHTGSPMGTILHSIRGMMFCVPRNMVQAAGMYNTLFSADDPAFVCEVLNAYRLKEAVPENLSTFKVELGVPEVLAEGNDVTLVTYGACTRIALDAATLLSKIGISLEVIDVQTLVPFDKYGVIYDSIAKTNSVLFLDEDVSGGASAYMMQKSLDEHNAHDLLDATPRTLTAKDHRGAYASDGDYYSKPNAEDVSESVFEIMAERFPARFR